MAISGNSIKTITTRQRRAIAALLTEKDAKKAAESAGVGYRSLCRWLDDKNFQAELRRSEGEIIGGAVRSLINDMNINHEVMRNIRDGRGPVNVKLRAAIALDQALLKWREALDIEQRLTELEKAVFNGKK